MPNSLPDCCFVVQDLPEVVPLARANIERDIPSAFKEGRIMAEAHNFFEPQPRVSDDRIFIFRYILHDWPDADCISILKNTMVGMGRKVREVHLIYSCTTSYMRSRKFSSLRLYLYLRLFPLPTSSTPTLLLLMIYALLRSTGP